MKNWKVARSNSHIYKGNPEQLSVPVQLTQDYGTSNLIGLHDVTIQIAQNISAKVQ